MRKTIAVIRIILTIVLPVLGFLAFLAGTDIYHNSEPNLSVEWAIFCSFYYLCYFYIAVNIADLLMNKKCDTK